MKRIYTFGLSVAVVALLISVGQLSAWTKPSSPAPGGNVAAPINTSDTLQTKAGNIIANIFGAVTAVWSDQYCDEMGQNCLDLASCQAGDSLVKQADGSWGCSVNSVTPPVDYLAYAEAHCGLTVPNPGSASLHAVKLKNGALYDLYDRNGAYSVLDWGCNGPDSTTDFEIESACGFSVPNPGSYSLHAVVLKNGGLYDLFDGNRAYSLLEWSCAGNAPAAAALGPVCGLSVPNPGSFSLHAVKLKNGGFYDLYDENNAYSVLEWSCK